MIIKNLWTKLLAPKPFREGYLPIVDGHSIWFAEYGNKTGKPVLITHGGPGGRCKPYHIKPFDLKKYHIIMFDQRGCGRSLPLGCLKHNTTDNILFDMERLLEHLQIKEKIILRGGSWASTLALLFAEKHPDKIEKLLLSQIFLADQINEEWEQNQCALFYPDMLKELRKPLKNWQTIPEYYFKELISGETERQIKALETYGSFERILGSLAPHWRKVEIPAPRELEHTQIYAHYAVGHYFIKNNEIMRNIKKIKHIPTLIVHNRLDMLCPLQGAYELAQHLDHAKLIIVPEKGHVSKLLYKTLYKEIKAFL